MDSNTTMWAVHVLGPDDLHACPDREVADALALLLNRQFARSATAQVLGMRASVIPWPLGYEAWKTESEQLNFQAGSRSAAAGGLTQCDMHEDETW